MKMGSSSEAAKFSKERVLTAKDLEDGGAEYRWGDAWVFPDGSKGIFGKKSALASGNNLRHYLFEVV